MFYRYLLSRGFQYPTPRAICCSFNRSWNTAVLVLTKSDLEDDTKHIESKLKSAFYEVDIHFVNALDSVSCQRLLGYFGRGKTVALLGSSGVGSHRSLTPCWVMISKPLSRRDLLTEREDIPPLRDPRMLPRRCRNRQSWHKGSAGCRNSVLRQRLIGY